MVSSESGGEILSLAVEGICVLNSCEGSPFTVFSNCRGFTDYMPLNGFAFGDVILSLLGWAIPVIYPSAGAVT